jgi:hypothetical protein
MFTHTCAIANMHLTANMAFKIINEYKLAARNMQQQQQQQQAASQCHLRHKQQQQQRLTSTVMMIVSGSVSTSSVGSSLVAGPKSLRGASTLTTPGN